MPTRRKEKTGASAARQARLRDRRKAEGFKRVTIWLSPEQVDTLESFGGSDWLGSTVKAFLESAVAEHLREPARQAALFDNPEPAPVVALPDNKAALWREADSLNASGLSWGAIARQWNEQGRKTPNLAEFRGGNIAREVRKWRNQAGGAGE